MTEAVWERQEGAVTFRLPKRAAAAFALMIVGLAAVLVASLMTGTYPLDVSGVLSTLFAEAPNGTAETVVWEFRFPRTIVAMLAGALLALSGATLQNVTRNPLADPSLVGVSQGASLAVVSLIIACPGTHPAWRPVAAFAGALLIAAIIQLIAMRRTGGATMRFILTGIGLAAFIAACTQGLLTYGDIDRAQSALGWLAGSVHAATWTEVGWLSACTALVVPFLFWASRPMAAIRMGNDTAISLGVKLRATRIALITLSVALAAFAVAAVGPLAFVGLIAPHIARRLARSGVGLHLALSAASGALLVGLADLLGRAAFAPIQIPAGIVTAILGVPVFIWLILRTQSRQQL